MSRYTGAEADAMRAVYKSTSLSSISNDFKSYYENLYDGVEVLETPTFDDDSLGNRLIVEEYYKINDIWKPMVGKGNNIEVDFTPYSILDVFMSPDEKTRKTPFALYYPSHKKHQITVKLPKRWGPGNDDLTKVSSRYFDFSMSSKMNKVRDILYLEYEYENKSNHVSPEDFDVYYTKIKKVERNLSYYIYIPKSEANNKPLHETIDTDKIVSGLATMFYWIFGIILIIVVGLAIYAVQSNRKRER